MEPLPYGVFFDEFSAYMFQLEVSKKGRGNNYESSRFLCRSRIPLAIKAGGVPDEDKIRAILTQRHNLFAKLPSVDITKLQQIAQNLRSGGSEQSKSTNGDGAGFDQDETTVQEAAKSATKPPAGQTKQATKAQPPKTQTKTTAAAPPKQPVKAPDPQPEPQPDPAPAEIAGETPVSDDIPLDVAADAPAESGTDKDVEDLLSQLVED